MSMTITNASREVRVKDDSESVSAVASCVASGLLRGARGNSGVILSLIFRGISKGLKGLDEADGAAIASALEHGSSSGHRGENADKSAAACVNDACFFEHGEDIRRVRQGRLSRPRRPMSNDLDRVRLAVVHCLAGILGRRCG